ncbi:MAG: DUF1566 domain-containing protein [Myxococcota bacterium]
MHYRHYLAGIFLFASITAQAQILKMRAPEIWTPGLRPAQQALSQITKSVASAETIKRNAAERESGMSVLGKERSLGSNVRKHRQQIKTLRSELSEALRDVRVNDPRSANVVRSELYDLLNKKPADEQGEESSLFGQQDVPGTFCDVSAQAQSIQGPVAWTAPTAGTAAAGAGGPSPQLGPAPQAPAPLSAIVNPTPTLAVAAEPTVRTQPMTVSPLARVGDWYQGPRESKTVPALEWELGRMGTTKMTFEDAQAYAASRAHADWRLPTIWELEALYQQQNVLGSDLDTEWFWSDTAVVSRPRAHWFVHFSGEHVYSSRLLIRSRVRLVRSRDGWFIGL